MTCGKAYLRDSLSFYLIGRHFCNIQTRFLSDAMAQVKAVKQKILETQGSGFPVENTLIIYQGKVRRLIAGSSIPRHTEGDAFANSHAVIC